MRFWDSSALGSLLLDEVHSASAQPLLDQDHDLVVWWGTPTECLSVIWGASRRGRLSAYTVSRSEERLFQLSRSWTEVQPSEELRELAARVIRVHDLRAADALQLAAALIASKPEIAPLSFVCFDKRLAQAAQREGLPVLSNPELHL